MKPTLRGRELEAALTYFTGILNLTGMNPTLRGRVLAAIPPASQEY
jgi:hypothetical protein